MKLVGATNWFIRVPFMLEGVIQGLIGSVFALVGLWFLDGFMVHDGRGLYRPDVEVAGSGQSGHGHEREGKLTYIHVNKAYTT